jgi:biopolymer transport protein ExbB/TolQ
MSEGAGGVYRRAYLGTLALLALALAFPIGLMVLNPTLMFERGWEQYLGTAIYLWAVLTLARELQRLWANERAFADAPAHLNSWTRGLEQPGRARSADETDGRLLPARLRQLGSSTGGSRPPAASQLMELNREASGLDQEQTAGRFTLTRYILYLLPVIGFIGTVEGISKALMNISRVLPMVKDLDGFLNNLTGVTSALQIAFDSTLLALFLSAALMLVQTLVYRRAEDLLARVDRWVVENVLPRVSHESPQAAALADTLGPYLEKLHGDLTAAAGDTARAIDDLGKRLGEGLAPHVARFAETVNQLPPALAEFRRGADAVGRLGSELEALGELVESARRAAASLGRIEATLAANDGGDEQLEAIRQGIDRTCGAVETLSSSIAHSFERSSRATQEQLARTLNNLKDALELLNVSMEQGNSLYRSIVKKLVPAYATVGDDQAA